jgi:hypothetical protein
MHFILKLWQLVLSLAWWKLVLLIIGLVFLMIVMTVTFLFLFVYTLKYQEDKRYEQQCMRNFGKQYGHIKVQT